MRTPAPPPLRFAWALVVLFTVSGVVHLVRPEVFTPIVPDALPAHRFLVYLSGVAELLCAAGLVWRRTRRVAGWASAALLVAVFPANMTMAVDAWGDDDASRGYLLATLVRLPLQLPMIWWAWRVTRPAGRPLRPGARERPRRG